MQIGGLDVHGVSDGVLATSVRKRASFAFEPAG
jgi:hypothetical protein